jgi:hypothetical protein
VHTDHTNRDPHARTFSMPKWNRGVRVTDDHRIFRRLPEFSGWTKDRHYRVAVDYLAAASVTRDTYQAAINRAFAAYGDGDGVLISGVIRDHFPDPIKDSLRVLAHEISAHSDKSLAHWRASGRRVQTWRDLRDRIRLEATS